MTTVGDPYLNDYEQYIADLERESGANLQRFRISDSAIQWRTGGIQQFNEFGELTSTPNPRYRFVAMTYFLGQLNALLGYMQSQPKPQPSKPPEPPETEWPTDIED